MAETRSPRQRTQPPTPWRFVIRRAWHGFRRHRGIDSAAALSFFAALGVIPGALAIVSAFAIFSSRSNAEREIMAFVNEVASESAATAARTTVDALFSIPNPAVALAVASILAVWSFSAYATACGRAINTVYEVQEGRRILKFRGLMLLVSIALSVMAIPVIAIIAITPRTASAIGSEYDFGEPWLTLWNVGKWPVLALLVSVIVATLYYFTPNVRHERWRLVSIGAVFAMVTWALATAGFAFYVSNIGRYDQIYGWVGGAITLLIWLFISNVVLVLGAELDAELVRVSQLLGGVEAEEIVQLPMRDTTRNLILARQRASDISDGRAIRENADDERARNAKHRTDGE